MTTACFFCNGSVVAMTTACFFCNGSGVAKFGGFAGSPPTVEECAGCGGSGRVNDPAVAKARERLRSRERGRQALRRMFGAEVGR